MKRLLQRLRRDKKGGALIEMAFILPLFTFMTLAIFEFAIIFFYAFVLESAMYNVTRFAKVQLDPQTVQQEVRNRIGQLSLGLMDPNKVIITTKLDVNFADEWQNDPAERCVSVLTGIETGDDCSTLPDCNAPDTTFSDINTNGECDIGPPPLELGVPGAIISYVAFYKKALFTPGLGLFTISNSGSFLNSNTSGGKPWHLISSATVTRNEPVGPQTP